MRNKVTTRDKTNIPLGNQFHITVTFYSTDSRIMYQYKGYNRVKLQVTRSKDNNLQNSQKMFQFIRKQMRNNKVYIAVIKSKITNEHKSLLQQKSQEVKFIQDHLY